MIKSCKKLFVKNSFKKCVLYDTQRTISPPKPDATYLAARLQQYPNNVAKMKHFDFKAPLNVQFIADNLQIDTA